AADFCAFVAFSVLAAAAPFAAAACPIRRISPNTVFNRAISRRITLSRSGSSSGSVALRKTRRKRSSSSSRARAAMSSTDISRISSARMSSTSPRVVTRHELRSHRHLGRGERHRLLGDLARHALELEHHAARLHHRDPHLGRALALSHAGLGGLLGDRLVQEYADPHFAAALDVARQRHTGSLDLPGCDPPGLQRLQAVGAERDLTPTMGEPSRATLEPLAEFDALW